MTFWRTYVEIARYSAGVSSPTRSKSRGGLCGALSRFWRSMNGARSMGRCNSHKCHCPRCMRARRIIEEREQLTPYERLLEARRKGSWKRLARQHHVDQAGVCCAPRAFCTCPNCTETREFYTFSPDSADNWVRSMFTDPPTRMSSADAIRKEAAEHYRAVYGLDTPWSDPPRKKTFLDWPRQAKEVPMLTVLQLAILSHHIVHPGVPYPYACSPGFGNVTQALEELIIAEFLERRLEGGYKITNRTAVYFHAINTLPLPVRKPAPWTMPS